MSAGSRRASDTSRQFSLGPQVLMKPRVPAAFSGGKKLNTRSLSEQGESIRYTWCVPSDTTKPSHGYAVAVHCSGLLEIVTEVMRNKVASSMQVRLRVVLDSVAISSWSSRACFRVRTARDGSLEPKGYDIFPKPVTVTGPSTGIVTVSIGTQSTPD